MEQAELLGKTVQCLITGFTGIATAKVQYINGCTQYCVKPRMREDGKMPDGEYIDWQQLIVVEDGVEVSQSTTGGPQRDCPKH